VALALQAPMRCCRPGPSAGDERWSGWQSMSDWAPSKLTRLAEQAAIEKQRGAALATRLARPGAGAAARARASCRGRAACR
jgi:hypothetical protein